MHRPHDDQILTVKLTQLLAGCAREDYEAFRNLYKLMADMLYGVGLAIVRDRTLADDVLHETLLQVWKNAGRFDPEQGSPRAWLVSLARYRALDAVKRLGRPASVLDLDSFADPGPDALEQLETVQTGRALLQCLRELESERRRLVLLAYAQGFTHADLAARLSKPLGTVKSALRRALKELRICLGGRA